jgi:Archease protein family (MTH1598/TM1083)
VAGFELLEHTADVGIRARGATLEEAFEQATLGLAEILGALAPGGSGGPPGWSPGESGGSGGPPGWSPGASASPPVARASRRASNPRPRTAGRAAHPGWRAAAPYR